MQTGRGGVRGRLGVAVGMLMAMCVVVAPAEAASRHPTPRLSISVLSGRADLVSGGSSLVAINLPRRADARRIRLTLGRRNVTRAFAVRPDGRFEALLTGLALGANRLTAALPSGWSARITLTDHPSGGPVFSGPQLKPWTCQRGAVDAQCDQPPSFAYKYMSTDPLKHGFQPYDPSNPATRRCADDDRSERLGAVHRARRDRLHGS